MISLMYENKIKKSKVMFIFTICLLVNKVLQLISIE